MKHHVLSLSAGRNHTTPGPLANDTKADECSPGSRLPCRVREPLVLVIYDIDLMGEVRQDVRGGLATLVGLHLRCAN